MQQIGGKLGLTDVEYKGTNKDGWMVFIGKGPSGEQVTRRVRMNLRRVCKAIPWHTVAAQDKPTLELVADLFKDRRKRVRMTLKTISRTIGHPRKRVRHVLRKACSLGICQRTPRGPLVRHPLYRLSPVFHPH